MSFHNIHQIGPDNRHVDSYISQQDEPMDTSLPYIPEHEELMDTFPPLYYKQEKSLDASTIYTEKYEVKNG